jgi:hypothetical protein
MDDVKELYTGLVPVTDWPNRFPWPPIGGLRHLIFQASARRSSNGTIPGNGLIEAGAIVRCGRRVLINPSRFFAWVEQQNLPLTEERRGRRRP